MQRFNCNKLVRDKIIDILTAKNIKINFSDDPNIEKYFKEKIIEEAQEIKNAVTKAELIEKFADLLEVLYAYAKILDISNEEIETMRIKKLKEKGGFENNIVIKEIAIDETNPAITKYKNNKQYEEIK